MSTPGRKKRENNFFDIGVQGRKTGITLKDTGIRDEHGFEPIDGIFSSPERSQPKKRPIKKSDGTLTSSTDMDVQQSSIPEPDDTLHARHVLRGNSRTIFPPPLGRSPIKTNLGSSPRRQSSMGPVSQLRKSVITPYRATSHPAVNRRLDFGADENDTGPETPIMAKEKRDASTVQPRLDIFAVQSPEKGRKRTFDDSIAEADDSIDVPIIPYDDIGLDDNEPLLDFAENLNDVPDLEPEPQDDETIMPPPKKKGRTKTNLENHSPPREIPAEPSQPPAKRGRGRSKLLSAPQRPDVGKSNEVPIPGAERKRGRPSDFSTVLGNNIVDDAPTLDEPIASTTDAAPKRKGRPKGSGRKLPVHRDADTEDVAGPSAKPAKGRKPKKSAPKERDANIFTSPKKPILKSVEARSFTSSPTKSTLGISRPLQVERYEDPGEGQDHYRTKRGRLALKPLQFWKNEGVERTADGSAVRVIRKDDVVEKKQTRRRIRRGRRATTTLSVVDEEEDESQIEPWEEEGGALSVNVRSWDESMGIGEEGELMEEVIAWSAAHLNNTRPVDGANFSFMRIFTNHYIGSGMIDIPVGGFKRTKSARRMYMLFFVHKGRVQAVVNNNSFIVSQGGSFGVPRGNTYSLSNAGEKPVKLFYAQGNETRWEEVQEE
ncbi:hypothetical protein M501DRAFT_986919 [Patellaria atrata CBS 101060]|uniref:Mif2/CENP-C cupin domain-containing protein n=1 Tax=Patellaria atrata CBS 101060 TaxID=1346257 RepID=A0A9P4S8Q3_9PEZI|nr:hypothetical protein M501DRAFT_986919 [Patellaria atrata CBS 101060]